jgi:hypothetical protein
MIATATLSPGSLQRMVRPRCTSPLPTAAQKKKTGNSRKSADRTVRENRAAKDKIRKPV